MAYEPPNDVRHFLHKRILRGLGFGEQEGFQPRGPGGPGGSGFPFKFPRKRTPRLIDQFLMQVIPRKGLPEHFGLPAHGHPGAILPGHHLPGASRIGTGPGEFLPALPGGGLPSGPCFLPWQRPDPVTGKCGTFAGRQPGPEPGGVGGGQAVAGGFGLPAFVPDVVGTIQRADGSSGSILRCGRGMVLGIDNLCYPKAVMPRRSKFRKWRGQVRPPVSAADGRAIRRAASAKDRVLQLAKDVGLHASKSKPATRGKTGHQHLLAPPTLRVIAEEHS